MRSFDDLSFELSLKEHKFTPSELTIPADKRVKLTIKNLDSTPAEFESHNFNVEKVIPAGGEVSLYIGPLKGGTYGFFDDFHEDETKGTLIARCNSLPDTAWMYAHTPTLALRLSPISSMGESCIATAKETRWRLHPAQ